MNLQQLINSFREVCDDKSALPLWSDTLLAFYANEGQVEAARRARLFKDSTTDGICVYAVTAGDRNITLEPRVIIVRSVMVDSVSLPLRRIHQADINKMLPGWDRGQTDGDGITHFITDRDTGLIWFNAPFPTDDTVRLAVNREPLAPMALTIVVGTNTTSAVDPEVRGRHQFGLINWMAYRALNMRDVEEKYDPKAAQEYLDMFEAEFGKRSSAIDETWIEREQMYDDHDGTF